MQADVRQFDLRHVVEQRRGRKSVQVLLDVREIARRDTQPQTERDGTTFSFDHASRVAVDQQDIETGIQEAFVWSEQALPEGHVALEVAPACRTHGGLHDGVDAHIGGMEEREFDGPPAGDRRGRVACIDLHQRVRRVVNESAPCVDALFALLERSACLCDGLSRRRVNVTGFFDSHGTTLVLSARIRMSVTMYFGKRVVGDWYEKNKTPRVNEMRCVVGPAGIEPATKRV